MKKQEHPSCQQLDRSTLLNLIIELVSQGRESQANADSRLMEWVPSGTRPVDYLMQLEDMIQSRCPGQVIDLDDRQSDVTLGDLAELLAPARCRSPKN